MRSRGFPSPSSQRPRDSPLHARLARPVTSVDTQGTCTGGKDEVRRVQAARRPQEARPVVGIEASRQRLAEARLRRQAQMEQTEDVTPLLQARAEAEKAALRAELEIEAAITHALALKLIGRAWVRMVD